MKEKRFLTATLAAITVLALVPFFTACGDKPDVSTKTLTHITASGTYKTAYFPGDSFDKTGLVVTAFYDDGTNKTVSNYKVGIGDFIITLPDNDTTFEISYTENGITKTARTQTITVTPRPQDNTAELANAAIANAKAAIENADYIKTYPQGTEYETVKNAVQAAIDGLDHFGCTVKVIQGTVPYFPAVAGTSLNPYGKDGYMEFLVYIQKAYGTQKITEITIKITATPYQKPFYPLAVPTDLQIFFNSAIWNGVAHAETYTIKINGNEIPVRGNSYSLAELPNGDYTMSVKSNGYEDARYIYTDSAYCAELSFSIQQ